MTSLAILTLVATTNVHPVKHSPLQSPGVRLLPWTNPERIDVALSNLIGEHIEYTIHSYSLKGELTISKQLDFNMVPLSLNAHGKLLSRSAGLIQNFDSPPGKKWVDFYQSGNSILKYVSGKSIAVESDDGAQIKFVDNVPVGLTLTSDPINDSIYFLDQDSPKVLTIIDKDGRQRTKTLQTFPLKYSRYSRSSSAHGGKMFFLMTGTNDSSVPTLNLIPQNSGSSNENIVLFKLDVETGVVKPVVNISDEITSSSVWRYLISIGDLQLSPDGSSILIFQNHRIIRFNLHDPEKDFFSFPIDSTVNYENSLRSVSHEYSLTTLLSG